MGLINTGRNPRVPGRGSFPRRIEPARGRRRLFDLAPAARNVGHRRFECEMEVSFGSRFAHRAMTTIHPCERERRNSPSKAFSSIHQGRHRTTTTRPQRLYTTEANTRLASTTTINPPTHLSPIARHRISVAHSPETHRTLDEWRSKSSRSSSTRNKSSSSSRRCQKIRRWLNSPAIPPSRSPRGFFSCTRTSRMKNTSSYSPAALLRTRRARRSMITDARRSNRQARRVEIRARTASLDFPSHRYHPHRFALAFAPSPRRA